MATNTVYDIVTSKIIEKLESGVNPWVKPWGLSNQSSLAMNYISKKPYRGINFVLTNFSGYSSPYWLTYKQANSLNGQVRKGQKSTPIVYFAKVESKSVDKPDYMMIRYFNVFNLEQIDGIDAPSQVKPLEFNSIESAEKVINGYSSKPPIKFVDQSAYYAPSMDLINMPKKESFNSVDAYYSTLFHELAHSTGSVNRLNRDGVTNIVKFGSHSYSREELIAELTSSMLCVHSGIESQLDQSASYLNSWIKVLKGDSRLIVQASSQAQKAADYILGTQYSTESDDQSEE
jgi:antirestriction protein ArdC